MIFIEDSTDKTIYGEFLYNVKILVRTELSSAEFSGDSNFSKEVGEF